MMEKDRVFELLKQGPFQAKTINGIEMIYKLHWANCNELIIVSTSGNGYSLDKIEEIVPWVDKYKDMLGTLVCILSSHMKDDSDLKIEDIEFFVNKTITEIETLHNKGADNE